MEVEYTNEIGLDDLYRKLHTCRVQGNKFNVCL